MWFVMHTHTHCSHALLTTCAHIHCLISVNIQQALMNAGEYNSFPHEIWLVCIFMSDTILPNCNKAQNAGTNVQPLLSYHYHLPQ